VTNREHGDAGQSQRLLRIGWNYIVSERSVDVPFIEFDSRPRHQVAFPTSSGRLLSSPVGLFEKG